MFTELDSEIVKVWQKQFKLKKNKKDADESHVKSDLIELQSKLNI